MIQLNTKTEAVLDYIKSHFLMTGAGPTLREIMQQLDFASLSSVQHHLKKLTASGHISLTQNIARGIELLPPATGIPILGEISAGLPLEAEENIQGYLNLPDLFTNNKNTFSLKINGDSMEGAGIMDGDMVIIKSQPTASRGQIVAALVHNEALVKRLIEKRGRLYLKAENPNYDDILVGNEVSIIGKVIGVMRNYV